MTSRLLSLLLLAAAALPHPALAGSARYALDPVHTRVGFAIGHAGLSHALGTISGSRGTLEFDPDDWSGARVEVTVPVARLDLGEDKWNRAALARNLLDAERHPQAHFASTLVTPLDARHARVEGVLTLRGVSNPVVLDVTFNALKRHPLPPFRRTVGFSATTRISRAAFGIDAWKSVIGDEVDLRLEVEAVRDTRGGDEHPIDEPVGDEPAGDEPGNNAADVPALPQTETPEPTP